MLTELGRVTWAAILLEDYTESLCSFIDPSDPRTDKRSVSQKLRAARKILTSWSASSARGAAIAWLDRAQAALERRNAALHATPLVWTGSGQQGSPRFFLGEMPRKSRPYVERPLTVESLADLRSVLNDARAGWRDLLLDVADERLRQTR